MWCVLVPALWLSAFAAGIPEKVLLGSVWEVWLDEI